MDRKQGNWKKNPLPVHCMRQRSFSFRGDHTKSVAYLIEKGMQSSPMEPVVMASSKPNGKSDSLRRACFAVWEQQVEYLVDHYRSTVDAATSPAQLTIPGNELLGVLPLGIKIANVPKSLVQDFAGDFVSRHTEYTVGTTLGHKPECTCNGVKGKACWAGLRVAWKWIHHQGPLIEEVVDDDDA